MGYYNSGHSYYKYSNLNPVAAAVNRARDQADTDTQHPITTRNAVAQQYENYLPSECRENFLNTQMTQPVNIQDEINKRNKTRDPRFYPLETFDDLVQDIFYEHANHTINEHLPVFAQLIRNPNARHNIVLRRNHTITFQCQYKHTPWTGKLEENIKNHIRAQLLGEPTCPTCLNTYKENKSPRSETPRTPTTRIPTTRHFYLHEITDHNNNIIAYKYGITIDINNRRTQQQRHAEQGLTLTTIYTLTGQNRRIVKLEQQLHHHLHTTLNHPQGLTQAQLPDGYTETISAKHITLTNLINLINKYA
mgnify:FL=1